MPVGSATLSIAMQKFYTYFHYFYWIHILKLSKNARIPQWNFFWYQFIHYNEDQGNNLMMLTILWNLARWSMYMNRHLFYTCQRCSKFFSVREWTMRMTHFTFTPVIFWGVLEVVHGLNWAFLKSPHLIIHQSFDLCVWGTPYKWPSKVSPTYLSDLHRK